MNQSPFNIAIPTWKQTQLLHPQQRKLVTYKKTFLAWKLKQWLHPQQGKDLNKENQAMKANAINLVRTVSIRRELHVLRDMLDLEYACDAL